MGAYSSLNNTPKATYIRKFREFSRPQTLKFSARFT